MRTKDELFFLSEVTILLQYLYMNEEHSILFNNGIADLEVKMTEEYSFKVLNHNFKDLGWSNFTEFMTLPAILGIIDILKETCPKSREYFSTEWEEIVKITSVNLALNRTK